MPIVIHAQELEPGQVIGGFGTVTAVLDADDELAIAESATDGDVAVIFLRRGRYSVRVVRADMPCWVTL